MTDATIINAFRLLQKGGAWLGAARSWIQCRCRNGNIVTWGSSEVLEGPLTVRDVEEIAAEAVAAGMRAGEVPLLDDRLRSKNLMLQAEVAGLRTDNARLREVLRGLLYFVSDDFKYAADFMPTDEYRRAFELACAAVGVPCASPPEAP